MRTHSKWNQKMFESKIVIKSTRHTYTMNTVERIVLIFCARYSCQPYLFSFDRNFLSLFLLYFHFHLTIFFSLLGLHSMRSWLWLLVSSGTFTPSFVSDSAAPLNESHFKHNIIFVWLCTLIKQQQKCVSNTFELGRREGMPTSSKSSVRKLLK